MSHALKNTYALLMDYLNAPQESILVDIISQLEQAQGDFTSFISKYRLLLASPQQELDLVSELDILYEDAFSAPNSVQGQNPNKLGEDALDLLDDFVEEANEQLIILVEALLGVESNPDNAGELITRAFRAMHTIKGSAGFLSLSDIITVAHEAETVLGKARETGSLKEEMISVLLNITQGIEDAIEQMQKDHCTPNLNTHALTQPLYDTQTQNRPTPFPKEEKGHMEIFRPKSTSLSRETVDILDDFVDEAHDLLTNYCDLLQIGKNEFVEQEREEVFRYIHNLRINAQAIGLSTLTELAKAGENLLNQETGTIKEEHRSALLSIQEGIKRILHNLSQYQREGKENNDEIISRLENLNASQPKIVIPTTQPSTSSHLHSLRVPVQNLNRIMNLSTELVVLKNRLQSLLTVNPTLLEPLYQQLKTISRELQQEIEVTRLQPIALAFRKVPKIVREASKITKKNVEVLFKGETLGLDKSLLDKLQEPILHLVRNAIDHGIETPEIRKQNNKSNTGTIRLNAHVQGGMFCLDIEDDGAGINIEGLCQKALQKGIITQKQLQEFSLQQKHNILFQPGLSSKNTANELSGRGMGMDIVKSKIEQLRGSIHVESQLGIGTTILIHVPLSVRVMQTLLIPNPSISILIPQLRIQEVRKIEDSNISILGHKRYYNLDGILLPCISLSKVLDQDAEKTQKLIICNRGNQLFGIEVVKESGFQEVVSHTVPLFIQETHLYQGTTILENGHPALIINLDHIFDQYELIGYEQSTTSVQVEKKHAYVIFSTSCLMAVSLSDILHVSKFSNGNISQCSGWDVFRYGEDSYPLITPSKVISSKQPLLYTHKYVLLFSDKNTFGIPVSSIQGIFRTTQDLHTTMKRKGVLGTIRYRDKDVEVIDTQPFYTFIRSTHVSV